MDVNTGSWPRSAQNEAVLLTFLFCFVLSFFVMKKETNLLLSSVHCMLNPLEISKKLIW